VPDTYTYTGPMPLGYPQYTDLETGAMLSAQPGEDYQMRSVEGDMPVPPGDGRWALVPPPVVPPKPVPVPPSPAPSPAAASPAASPAPSTAASTPAASTGGGN
jgi:hypothetical protein